jgi:hypothetical protein
MELELGSILATLNAAGFSSLNTILLIIIAVFVHRQIKAYDKQTEKVTELLNSHEQRITRLETFREAEQL